MLPTERQLRSIVESGAHRRVRIGTSPLAANAEVCVDPDRLFGRHLAVLGNTGSGKSCSVAGLIRWSLDAAKAQRRDDEGANARFLILDPNGEYRRAFGSEDPDHPSRVFRIEPGAAEEALRVPLWFWNSGEWAAFTQASAKMQRPLLKRALREVKAGRGGAAPSTEEERRLDLRRYLSFLQTSIRSDVRSGSIKTDSSKFGFHLASALSDLEARAVEHPALDLDGLCASLKAALNARYATFKDKQGQTVKYFRAFTEVEVSGVTLAIDPVLQELGGIVYEEGPDEDVPVRFKGAELADHLEMLSAQENASQFVDFLVARIRTFLSDSKVNVLVSDEEGTTLEQWLSNYLGGASSPHVAVLDLSLVPSDIVHVLTAVVARMSFEALQRYRKIHGVTLPTVIVMEEAHTFVKRYRDDSESRGAAAVCCQVFERIAREGRKFGLGLVLSSQRPSELSPTVLSQCNTFLLHRISNDRDQDLVGRLVPDNLRGLLRELPSLPSQHAVLLGWASELPLLVRMEDLAEAHRPQSDDPDFWDVWTGLDGDGQQVSRETGWKRVAEDWQGEGQDVVPQGPVPPAPPPRSEPSGS